MIIDKETEVTISKQGKYYASLGYPLLKQGSKLIVKIEDLPLNCNKKIMCKCDNCDTIFSREYQLLNKNKKLYNNHLCYSCSRKFIGKNMDRTNTDNATKSRTGENHPRWVKNKKPYNEYRARVRYITEQTYIEYKDIINLFDYPRTLCGVNGSWQLDHRISIKRGFKLGINPKVIGSLDNLQMLSWIDNLKKFDK